MRAQIDRLDLESQEAVEKYDAARADLDQVSARLTEMRRALDIAQTKLDAAQLVMSQRLSSMYKSDGLTLLDVLLNARDFSDIGTQLDYFRLVNQADRTTVDDVGALTRQVARLTSQLERDRADALKKETQLHALRADIEDQLAQRKALLDSVNGRIGKILARQRAAAEAAARRLAGDVDLDSITGTDAQLAVLRETMRWLGVPYVWGGAGPNGFDSKPAQEQSNPVGAGATPRLRYTEPRIVSRSTASRLGTRDAVQVDVPGRRRAAEIRPPPLPGEDLADAPVDAVQQRLPAARAGPRCPRAARAAASLGASARSRSSWLVSRAT